MSCKWLEDENGNIIHINMGRRGTEAEACPFCGTLSVSKLCDYPLSKDGKNTCDAKICAACSTTLGRGEVLISEEFNRLMLSFRNRQVRLGTFNDTIDVCPKHRGQALMVEGRIFANE